MFIRLSTEKDKEQIIELIEKCFGVRPTAYMNLTGRYLLAIKDNKIVGMSGLLYNEEYCGYEMDWTCTDPDYRGQGVMHEIFRRLTSLTDENIFCSCWRLATKDRINLYWLMKDFGFEEILKPRVAWARGYNCNNLICVNCTGDNCTCYEDLYIRRKRESKDD